ncbi:MAG: hypothetical protein A2081_02965 [Elusimicrobia bacterium GWC2_61_19]|nr:MAG: hypothetical protein A2081_02965 [Elusimicrobia bacterium GWC2_61_19]
MGYIDTNLLEGEQVLYRTKLHWMVFFWTAVWILLGLLSAIGGNNNSSGAAFFFFIALITGISALINYKTAEFGITNKRVLIKVGFIRRKSLETLLAKIEGIQVDQSLFGRMLNYGTITVTGTGGTHTPFARIATPLEFRKKVQEQISSAQKA